MKNRILNPYLPEYEYIPDGEPHVFENRVYIYGSHDRFDGEKFCMNDYTCYSADVTDLSDWRYEGIIYQRCQDIRLDESKNELWAPDVVKGPDGRYYLYYCPDASIKTIGVAVCDTPAGSYRFLGIVQDKEGNYIGERSNDTIQFDPGVFIDDGIIYLYSGNGARTPEDIGKEPKASVVMTLEQDMLTIKTEPKKLLPVLGEEKRTGFEGHEFFEASSIRKINDKYYLVYSSTSLHELCYALSDRPDGGYHYGGVLVSNCDVFPDSERNLPKICFGNNHGGIEYMNGHYYIFYHRQTNNTMFSRQGCAEKIEILEDGTIRQAEMTSCGLNDGPLPGEGVYPASCVCNLYGEHIPEVNDLPVRKNHPYLTQDGADYNPGDFGKPPRMYITNGEEGMVAAFKYFRIRCVNEIEVCIRGTADGILYVRTGPDEPPIGMITIKPARDWSKFRGKVKIPESVCALYFCYEGKGKINFLEFELKRQNNSFFV